MRVPALIIGFDGELLEEIILPSAPELGAEYTLPLPPRQVIQW
jgi:hypothetical protein